LHTFLVKYKRLSLFTIIFSILLTGGSVLTAEAQDPSVPDSYYLPSPSVENLDDLIGTSSDRFGPAGADVDTNLGGFEPHVAVNPLNPANVAVAQGNGLLLSADFGATFPTVVNALLPLSQQNQNPVYFFCGDPSLAFDSQGRLFWSYLTCSFQPPPAPPNTLLDLSVVVLQVNPTTGATIGNAVDVTPGIFVDDKNWLAADANPLSSFADNLYIVWVRFPAPVTVLYSMSTNQGVTWTAPQAISITGNLPGGEGFTWPPHITVAPNGDVYANYPTNRCGTTGTVQVLRDTNGGAQLAAGAGFQKTTAFTNQQARVTCNVQHIAGNIPQTDFWLQGSGAAYTIADTVTPGRIYVIGNDDPNNIFANGDDGDVVMATSNNFGVNWAVSTISSGPANSLQVMPTGAIDELGNICVSWYDTRNGQTNTAGNFLLDLFVTFSTDGGVTFTPDFQINDVAFDPDTNPTPIFNGPPQTLRIGEYNGIAAAKAVASAAWTGNDVTQFTNQDIFFDTFPCAAKVVGGEFLPIDNTTLLLAGAQSFSWMIPVILSGIGIGLFVVSRKSE